MSAGTVTAITTDWRGDTLAVAASTGDPSLTVESVIDFDEDGGWLTVGGLVVEYTAINEDTDVITLAAPLPTATLEAGLPVNVWDPTVAGGGAQVVEYVATVELHDGSGSPDAVIPHEMIPTSSVELLIGASVRIEQGADGDWFVSKVLGRKPLIDSTTIQTGPSGKRVVLLAGSSPAMLLYTADVDEAAPGQVSNTLVEVGALKSLITQVTSPKIAGATNHATLSLQSTNNGGTIERTATISADKLTLAGDRVESPNLYLTAPPTTAAAVNVNIGPGGQLRESTSSKRFKVDIEPAAIDAAAVLKILTVTFRDRAEVDADPTTTRRYIGVTAEQIHELGLTDFVTYDDLGRPHAVQYDRLFLALLAVVQHQDARLARIESALKLAPIIENGA